MRFVFALLPAAFIAGALYTLPAEAKCGDDPTACALMGMDGASHATKVKARAKAYRTFEKKTYRQAETKKLRRAETKKLRQAETKKLRQAETKKLRHAETKKLRHAETKKLRRKKLKTYATVRSRDDGPGRHGNVVAMIKSMAPSHGVPTWFALRIAKVESGYNPRVRGRAGEIGVFQLKCQTARGLGFGGSCGQLADARTNVQWGLKHLSMAIRSSSGNLQLAASKHNGGLGRKRLVRSYVAKVF